MADSESLATPPVQADVVLVVALSVGTGLLGAAIFVELAQLGIRDPIFTEMLVLQAATTPILACAAYVTYIGRPAMVPTVVLASLVGSGALVAAVMVTTEGPISVRAVVEAMGLGAVSVTGFVAAWATLGFVTGTAARWRRRDSVAGREVTVVCFWILAGGVVALVFLSFFASIFSGLGDHLV